MPDILTIKSKIISIKKYFKQTGLPDNAKIFGAGHSLGGIIIQSHALKK